MKCVHSSIEPGWPLFPPIVCVFFVVFFVGFSILILRATHKLGKRDKVPCSEAGFMPSSSFVFFIMIISVFPLLSLCPSSSPSVLDLLLGTYPLPLDPIPLVVRCNASLMARSVPCPRLPYPPSTSSPLKACIPPRFDLPCLLIHPSSSSPWLISPN
ncbi:hypothetical protein B0T10DRAFT_262490 [Thelonectria olida]|uniref:Uncharacterized protein n=1 Tax=Thelonectria olida TaxID=1576542 RepID=A0A9P8W824_9HYPO|nr:hypothetical protein B0T10DRAFT_262490 [Thelonectria olida]